MRPKLSYLRIVDPVAIARRRASPMPPLSLQASTEVARGYHWQHYLPRVDQTKTHLYPRTSPGQATRADVAFATVGVGVRAGAPKPDIGTVESFKQALLNAKSVAHSATGASGDHFKSILQRLGIT